jgi:hypothetical protein
MKYTLNGLSKVSAKKTSYSLLDPGWYEALIAEAEIKETQNGKIFLNLKLEIQSGDEQKDGSSATGRFAFLTIWLPSPDDDDKKYQSKTANLKAFLEVTETEMDGDDFDPDAIPGATIRIKIIHEVQNDKKNPDSPYNGKVSAKVDDWQAIS